MPCDHFREEEVRGEIKAVCKLCSRALRRNSGTMTMHYRIAHNTVADAVLSNYYEHKQVDGVFKFVCTLCGLPLPPNMHMMELHYKMVHHPLTTVPRHVCSFQKTSSEDGSASHIPSSTTACAPGARCDSNNARNIDIVAKQTGQVAERLQWIDALAQRYPGICTDPGVCRSMVNKAPPAARYILSQLLMRAKSQRADGICLSQPDS
jgi:hypothetical protein